MREQPSPSFFIEEAQRLVREAQNKGIILRVMGALAIRLHSPEFTDLHKKLQRLGRREFTDIDFVALGKQKKDIRSFLEGEGYKMHRDIAVTAIEYGRNIYYRLKPRLDIDVFLNGLRMCHSIDLKDRLEIDYPTIPLADILLEKMQIVEINEKDIKDSIVLLRAHEVGEREEEEINARYIADLLSVDWGFYYTVTTNLKKVEEFMPKYEALTKEDKETVTERVDKLLEYIEEEPKSLGWKIRSKIGTRKKWYREVSVKM